MQYFPAKNVYLGYGEVGTADQSSWGGQGDNWYSNDGSLTALLNAARSYGVSFYCHCEAFGEDFPTATLTIHEKRLENHLIYYLLHIE